ncbi:MAG: hypothetical protein D6795_08290, partial [Deltaproteobacteria bacterium]
MRGGQGGTPRDVPQQIGGGTFPTRRPASGTEHLRDLPAVQRLLTHERARRWIEAYGRRAVVAAVRDVLEETRRAVLAHPDPGECVRGFLADGFAILLDRI